MLQYSLIIGITVGIIIGLIVHFIAIPLLRFIGNWILMFISHYLFKMPILHRTWITKFQENGKEYTETVTLSQRGSQVKGNIVLSEEGDMYKFKGTFSNLILTAEYWSTDKENCEAGTFTLQLSKDGKTMGGKYILVSKVSGEKLIATDYAWHYKNR